MQLLSGRMGTQKFHQRSIEAEMGGIRTFLNEDVHLRGKAYELFGVVITFVESLYCHDLWISSCYRNISIIHYIDDMSM